MQLYEVLRRPIISEKGTALQALNKYLFEVSTDATKPQIKAAVEKAFKVKVLAVNVMTMPRKKRAIGRRPGFTSPWKKAVVTLQAGQKLEFYEGV